ncbi:MAG: S41 family peptidase [Myxococcota bacterium]
MWLRRRPLLLTALLCLLSEPGCEGALLEAHPESYAGIGAELRMEAAGARVIAVTPGGPAAQAGVVVEDLILSVDDRMLRGKSLAVAVESLRGPVGSESTLLLRTREGNKRTVVSRAALTRP